MFERFNRDSPDITSMNNDAKAMGACLVAMVVIVTAWAFFTLT